MHAALAILVTFCVPPVPRVQPQGTVTRQFVAPACERCAGHRGVTLARDGAVRAVVDGTIVFDGTVAGRRYLVISAAPDPVIAAASGPVTGARPGSVRTKPPDLRITYGDLSGPLRARGSKVSSGDMLGSSRGTFYLGVRVDGRPVDPRAVLGSPRAGLAPPAEMSCRGAARGPVGASR